MTNGRIDTTAVTVIDRSPVGINCLRQAAVVGPAGHFAVGVLNLGHHAARVGNRFRPPGGVITVAVDQNGVRAGGHGTGPGVGRAAVGADVDRVGDAVGLVVIQGLIADTGLVARGGRAEDTGIARAVVVEPVAVDEEDQITGGVVGVFLLIQDDIAGDVVGIGPGRIAPAIGLIAFFEPTGAIG